MSELNGNILNRVINEGGKEPVEVDNEIQKRSCFFIIQMQVMAF